MARIGDVTKDRSFESHPVIQSADLAGLVITLAGARGPYTSAEWKSEFMVVTVILPPDTPKQISKDGDVRDLFLGYIPDSQRSDLLSFFESSPDDVIGPVMLQARELPNNRSFWEFVEPES